MSADLNIEAERVAFEAEADKLAIPTNSVVAFNLWLAARRAPVASAPALTYLEQLAVEETLACVQEHSGTPLANKLSAIIARITGEGE